MRASKNCFELSGVHNEYEMDTSTVVIAVISSGAFAAIVSGGMSQWSQHAQEQRENRAARRQVNNTARAFARHVMYARQFGGGTVDGIPTAKGALADLIADRDILKALTNEQSAALGDAVHNSDGLATAVVRASTEDSKNKTPQDYEMTQRQISGLANGAFVALRRYFELSNDTATVNDFDKTEAEYQNLLRIRTGGTP